MAVFLACAGIFPGTAATSLSATGEKTVASWIYTGNADTAVDCNIHADCPDEHATFGQSCDTRTQTTCCSDATHDVFTCGDATEATGHFKSGGTVPGSACGVLPPGCPGRAYPGSDLASLRALGAPCDAPANGTVCGYQDVQTATCLLMTCAAVDATPDVFSFGDLSGQAPESIVASDSITISGLDAAASVSVSGDGFPQVRIDGGAWRTSGVITDRQTLEVRLRSAPEGGATHSAIVNVGGVHFRTWKVTTDGGPAGR